MLFFLCFSLPSPGGGNSSLWLSEHANLSIWDFCAFKHFKPSLFGIFHPPCPGNIAWLGSTNFVIGGFVSLRLQLSLGFLSGDLYTRTGKPLETRILKAIETIGEKSEINCDGQYSNTIRADNFTIFPYHDHVHDHDNVNTFFPV